MSRKILVVDDEKDIVEMLKYNLEKSGYSVMIAHNGKEALEKAQKHPDLILLDVMMPEMDGWEVCRQIKRDEKTSDIPVLFLTAKGGETDEVVGLELGADDYVVKPIALAKLLARIRSVLRRKESVEARPGDKGNVIRIQDLEINALSYEVKVASKKIAFPKKEFETLHYLASHRGRVISREKLLNAIWGENVYVVDRTVDVHIRKIREKLGKYGEYIETVKG
ncbi:MAG TPA: response regulator transcription factor, partial [Bacteroidota bacterium]|nr:response regulator transcription factor [Bacteroidota bacterium]